MIEEAPRPACYHCMSGGVSQIPCICDESCGRVWCVFVDPVDEWSGPPVPVFVPAVRVVPRVLVPGRVLMVDLRVVPCGMLEM